MNNAAADFKAHCPACGGRRWEVKTSDSLICTSRSQGDDLECGYIHYLHGPHANAYIGPTAEQIHTDFQRLMLSDKRKRIRAMIHISIGTNDSVEYALEQARLIDELIERIT